MHKKNSNLGKEKISQFHTALKQVKDVGRLSAEILKADKSISSDHVYTFKKIADNCNSDEFESFLTSGNVPAIKLSNSELKVLKGGVTPAFIVAAFCLGGAYQAGKREGWW